MSAVCFHEAGFDREDISLSTLFLSDRWTIVSIAGVTNFESRGQYVTIGKVSRETAIQWKKMVSLSADSHGAINSGSRGAFFFDDLAVEQDDAPSPNLLQDQRPSRVRNYSWRGQLK